MKKIELVFTSIFKKTKVLFWVFFLSNWINAQQHNKDILFENVSIFDGKSELILTNQHVLITGNRIALISKTALPKKDNMIVIDGKGKTLIPGLIDVHVHMIFGALSMKDMMDPNLKPESLLMKVVPEAQKMLLRGFTSVRDVGGPSFQLKQSIDDGTIQGPRIWPSGAMISQTSGHGDLRLPEERSRRFFGPISKAENFGA